MSDSSRRAGFLRQMLDEHGGKIPFDRWMAGALLHPEFGYYTSGIRALGARGDFSTWPGMNTALARSCAAWLKTHRPKRQAWQAIEVGAGDGSLAAGIRSALGWGRKPNHAIVEVSPKLEKMQRERLGSRATWHADMSGALRSCEGRALILANELVDAFPCRVFQQTGSRWLELHVGIFNGKAGECWEPPLRPLPQSTVFDNTWPEGQRIEVQESFFQWMKQWRDEWKEGRMVLIDYGDAADGLTFRRPGGTLRAYAHHQRFEGSGIYEGFGRRDLTVDVNFSDISRWSSALGYQSLPVQSLKKWMQDQGVRTPPEMDAAGDAFKVAEIVSA